VHSTELLCHSCICTRPSCFCTRPSFCLSVSSALDPVSFSQLRGCVCTQPIFHLKVASALDQVAVLHFHMHSTQLFSHICFCTRPSCRLTVACALGRVAVSQLHVHSAQSISHSCTCTRPSCSLAGPCGGTYLMPLSPADLVHHPISYLPIYISNIFFSLQLYLWGFNIKIPISFSLQKMLFFLLSTLFVMAHPPFWSVNHSRVLPCPVSHLSHAAYSFPVDGSCTFLRNVG